MIAIFCRNFWYILSISCQVTGTLAILIYTLGVRRKDIVASFAQNSFTAEEDGIIDYNKAFFRKFCRDRFVKFFSFFVLLVGFFLQIVSQKQDNEPLWLFLYIIMISSILFLIIHYASVKLSQRISKKSITPSELKEVGEDVNVRPMSFEDFDKIIENSKTPLQ